MSIDPAVTGRVRAAWARHRPVILPTDTVYGLVAPASDEAMVAHLFELKGRPVDRRMAVLVSDLDQAAEWIEVNAAIRRVAARFWPGAVTIVGARRPAAPRWVGDDSTLAVRCPDDELLRALATEVGPLAATSANRHGDPTAADATGVAAALPGVEVVIDGGPRPGAASTVVVVGDRGAEVVREGPVSAAEIGAVVEPRS